MALVTPRLDGDLQRIREGQNLTPSMRASPNPHQRGAWTSFGHAAIRNSSVLEAADNWATDTLPEMDAGAHADPDFDIRTWFAENGDEEDQRRLEVAMRNGEVWSGIFSPGQADAFRRALRRDSEVRAVAEANPTANFLGQTASGFAEPWSYIPFIGLGRSFGVAAKFGIGVGNAAIGTGIGELMLQLQQTDRPFSESVSATTFSAGAAGGLLGAGLASRAALRSGSRRMMTSAPFPRSSPAHSRNPNNPLAPQNASQTPPMRVRDGDGQVDEIAPDDVFGLGDARSVGADVVGDADLDFEMLGRWKPTGTPGKLAKQVAKVLATRTLGGRFMLASSTAARRIAAHLVDPGGIIMRHHVAGRAGPNYAEELKHAYMIEPETVWQRMGSDIQMLRSEVGRKVSERDVHRLVQRDLVRRADPQLRTELEAKYGPAGLAKIDEVAKRSADAMRRLNQRWEERLKAAGYLRDDVKLDRIKGELAKVRAEIEAIRNAEEGVEASSLSSLRERRDALQAQRRREARKPVPMGEDYGHAQLWDREAILQSPQAFRAFLYDLLATRPSDDYLAEYRLPDGEEGLTREAFDALRDSDPKLHDQILRDWAGDEWLIRVKTAEAAYEGAEQVAEQAALDLREALTAAGRVGRDEIKVTVSEARARRDKIAAELEATRQRRAETEAMLRAARSESRAVDLFGQRETPSARLKGRKPIQDRILVAQAKAEEQARQLWRESRRLERLETRLAAVDAALKTAETRLAETKARKAQLDEVVRAAKKARGVAVKDLGALKRALMRDRRKTPLDEMIESVYENLSTQGRVPHGIMDRIAPEADREVGRVKERVLQLTPSQRTLAFERGWLNDDLAEIFFRQNDQLSGEFSINEALGIGEGGRFDSWSDVVRFVRDDYVQMAEDAANRGFVDLAEKLHAEGERMVRDLSEVRDRIKGGVYDGAPDWLRFASNQFRKANLSRFVGGFTLTSLTDAATLALQHGGFLQLMARTGRATVREMRRAQKEDPRGFRAMVASFEVSQGLSAAARRIDSEDLMGEGGRGFGVGRTRRWSSAVDRTTEKVSEIAVSLSGLPLMTRYLKTVAALNLSGRIDDMVRGYKDLPVADRATLASLGIGRREAGRMLKFLERHGSRNEEGLFDPGLEKWTGDDGLLAARDFRLAILRDMNRSVITPGVADTPSMMSKTHGKLLFQFMSHGFASISRLLIPMFQRGVYLKDRKAYQAFLTLLVSGTFVVLGKDLIRGEDPMERFRPENARQFAYDIVDRSGLFAWTSPYVDSALKLAPFGLSGSSRYVRNDAADSLFGVNKALIDDAVRAWSSVTGTEDDVAARVNNVLLLAPLSTQTRLIASTFED